ncbi:DUF2628 domain-containing protein [Campylobacter sp. JMF_08 NE1]|uniref:DUF2628 domain-containing protein n=1 Tax=Campylobacter sp. JMF_08 NE1 TaxID=2983821 RepID=UPI0022E9BBDD|nr:DUF2628 domain-containing protein [Campylobacter sp. JMF_08 NE1]MDA3048384.1 DUF2628 domain-containing protein [Campylobacter sp. JMF_08 NE1]
MTDYAKEVFNDPKLLREKLALYIQTPKKVELYAKDCENFFVAGKGEKLEFANVFSWWGFFGTIFFLFYRKIYWLAGLIFAFTTLSSIIFPNLNPSIDRAIGLAISVVCGMFGRYLVCNRFLKFLQMQDDEILIKKGGVNYFAYVLFVLFLLLAYWSVVNSR